ncbi:MAG: anaerobic ribonucleoside-triphosphate reductase [Desulfuromonadales bacterium]
MRRCKGLTEVYSRVCGFFRPVQQWNRGKKEEFRQRKEYVVKLREDADGRD